MIIIIKDCDAEGNVCKYFHKGYCLLSKKKLYGDLGDYGVNRLECPKDYPKYIDKNDKAPNDDL